MGGYGGGGYGEGGYGDDVTYENSRAIAGRGSKLSIGPAVNTGGSTYTEIEEVKSASITGRKYTTVDVTNFDSPDNYEEFLATIIDPGSIACSGNYISTDPGQTALSAAFGTGSAYLFQLQLPLAPGQTAIGNLISFAAIVESFDVTVEPGKAIEFTSSLKVSGAIVITEGS